MDALGSLPLQKTLKCTQTDLVRARVQALADRPEVDRVRDDRKVVGAAVELWVHRSSKELLHMRTSLSVLLSMPSHASERARRRTAISSFSSRSTAAKHSVDRLRLVL